MQMNFNNTAPNKNNTKRGMSMMGKENGNIVELSMAEASNREILSAIGRSKNAVRNYL